MFLKIRNGNGNLKKKIKGVFVLYTGYAVGVYCGIMRNDKKILFGLTHDELNSWINTLAILLQAIALWLLILKFQ